jgi:hypothetical protein
MEKGERHGLDKSARPFQNLRCHHPDPIRILVDLHGNYLLTGKIIDVSDSGMQKNAFAVIEVEGIQELPVVATKRILGATEDGDANEPTR